MEMKANNVFELDDKITLTHKACEYLAKKHMAEEWPELNPTGANSGAYWDIYPNVYDSIRESVHLCP